MYDITVDQLTVPAPVDADVASREAFIGRALNADGTYFEDEEPPVPSRPSVPVTCSACGADVTRVRGSWTGPITVACTAGHEREGTVQELTAALRHPRAD
ncbi:hypothetical protein [Streptomyces sp. Da 82-17]|uniref:hypothetical protein n=1 Tax=Streptomyces sp. Da 82-17 TaxID=3377116 RepID=UPI0038D4BD01